MQVESYSSQNKFIITVVVPAYKVKAQILKVLESIGDEVQHILVVDDRCPDKSGEYVKDNFSDSNK